MADKWGGDPRPLAVYGESEKYLFLKSGRKRLKSTNWQTHHETKEEAVAAMAEASAAKKAANDREEWEAAALAACEGMTTAQLTPGCVAKLVEALEAVVEADNQDGVALAYHMATAALAAMKGE